MLVFVIFCSIPQALESTEKAQELAEGLGNKVGSLSQLPSTGGRKTKVPNLKVTACLSSPNLG